MNIALCGMMGCGKTSTAIELSQKLRRPLVDTDKIIEENYGAISDIFKERGEGYFRELEASVIAKYCKKDTGAVIALGGGAVLSSENVNILKGSSKIIYLRANEENLLKRLKNSTNRPLLNGTMRDRVCEILTKRSPIYERAADFIVDTDGCTIGQTCEKICEIVRGLKI